MHPYIKDFEDYHNIQEYTERSRTVRGEQLRSIEINLADYGWVFDDNFTRTLTYFGLFYRGSRPKNNYIKKLIWNKLKNRPEWSKG